MSGRLCACLFIGEREARSGRCRVICRQTCTNWALPVFYSGSSSRDFLSPTSVFESRFLFHCRRPCGLSSTRAPGDRSETTVAASPSPVTSGCCSRESFEGLTRIFEGPEKEVVIISFADEKVELKCKNSGTIRSVQMVLHGEKFTLGE